MLAMQALWRGLFFQTSRRGSGRIGMLGILLQKQLQIPPSSQNASPNSMVRKFKPTKKGSFLAASIPIASLVQISGDSKHALNQHSYRFLCQKCVKKEANEVQTPPPRIDWNAFIEHFGKSGNSVNIQRLLSVLKKLKVDERQVPGSFWDTLVTITRDRVAELSTGELVDVLHLFWKARVFKPEWILEICEGIFLEEASPRHISKLLFVLGSFGKYHRTLRRKSDQKMMYNVGSTRENMFVIPKGFVDKVVEASNLPSTLALYNDWDLANFVWGLSQLRYDNKAWIENLIMEVDSSGKFMEFGPKALSVLIYSLGQFKITNASIIQSILGCVCDNGVLESFPLDSLTSMVHGLARVNWKTDDQLTKIFDECATSKRLTRFSTWDLSSIWYGVAKCGFRDNATLTAFSQEVAKTRRLATFSEEGLVSVFWSAVSVGYKNDNLIEGLISEITKGDRLLELSCEHLCIVLWALHKLQESKPNVWVREMDLILQQLSKRTSIFEPRELCYLIYGLGFGGHDKVNLDHVLFQLKMFGASGEFQELSVDALCKLVHGLQNLKIDDAQVWDQVLEEVGRDGRMRVYENGGLATMVFLMGQTKPTMMTHNFPKVVEIIHKMTIVVMHRLTQLSNVELVKCLRGIARGKVVFNDAWECFAHEVAKTSRLDKFSGRQIATLICSFSRVGEIPILLMSELLTPRCLKDLQGPELVSLVFYLSKAHNMDALSFKRFLVMVCSREGLLAELPNRYASMLLWAIGHVRYQDQRIVKQIIEESVKPKRLMTYSSREFVSILYGLGRLGFDNEFVIDSVVQEFLRSGRLGEMDVEMLPIVLYSLSLLGFGDNEFVDGVMGTIQGSGEFDGLSLVQMLNLLSALSRYGRNDHKALPVLIGKILRSIGVNSVPHLHIATLLMSFGRLGYVDEHVVKFLDQALQEQSLRRFPNALLSCLVFCVAQLEYGNQDCVNKLVMEISRPERLHTYNYVDMGRIVNRLGHLNFGPNGTHCLPLLMSTIKSMVSEDPPPPFGSWVVYGLGHIMQKQPSLQWAVEIVELAIKEDKLEKLPIKELGRLIVALGTVPQISIDRILSIVRLVQKNGSVQELTTTGIILMLKLFANLHIMDAMDFKYALFREVVKPHRARIVSVDIANDLIQCANELGVRDTDTLSGLEEMRDAAIAKENARQGGDVVGFVGHGGKAVLCD